MKKFGLRISLSLIGLVAIAAPRAEAAVKHDLAARAIAIHAVQGAPSGDPSLIGGAR